MRKRILVNIYCPSAYINYLPYSHSEEAACDIIDEQDTIISFLCPDADCQQSSRCCVNADCAGWDMPDEKKTEEFPKTFCMESSSLLREIKGVSITLSG